MNGEMSVIVRTITRFVYGLTVIFGFYVVMHGHLTPGGGFQGGSVVATAFALLVVAFGVAGIKGKLNAHILQNLEEVGALAFIALGFIGIGTSFFYNIIANSGSVFGAHTPIGINGGILNTGGTLPWMNWAVGLKVMTGLAVVVLVMLVGARNEEEKR